MPDDFIDEISYSPIPFWFANFYGEKIMAEKNSAGFEDKIKRGKITKHQAIATTGLEGGNKRKKKGKKGRKS